MIRQAERGEFDTALETALAAAGSRSASATQTCSRSR